VIAESRPPVITTSVVTPLNDWTALRFHVASILSAPSSQISTLLACTGLEDIGRYRAARSRSRDGDPAPRRRRLPVATIECGYKAMLISIRSARATTSSG
jgi:hypothetical protein